MTEAPAADPRALRALLVEDSRLDAELLRIQLERAWPAAQLEVVREEAAFVSALRAGGWDVVLSDYELPGFTGADLLEHRNRIAPGVPFIFVSGVIGEDNAVELLKRGATDYVSKARLARLALVLQRALRELDERRARDLAERQLRQADMTFARVVDSLREHAVILLDDAGCVQFWNRAAGRIFGYTAAEMLGQPAAVLFPPDEDPREALRTPLGDLATHRTYLDQYRMTLVMKCDGLDATQLARRSVPPSTLSLLGLVRHLAHVEHTWFRRVLQGQADVAPLYATPENRDADFDGAVADPAVVAEAWATMIRAVAKRTEWSACAP